MLQLTRVSDTQVMVYNGHALHVYIIESLWYLLSRLWAGRSKCGTEVKGTGETEVKGRKVELKYSWDHCVKSGLLKDDDFVKMLNAEVNKTGCSLVEAYNSVLRDH